MAGQIAWLPKLGTINGVIVFDGSVWPPLGLLKEKVKLIIKEDKIVDFEGSREAVEFREWLERFKDQNMFMIAHVCYGL
ncbi:MAG: aminopeptidase, partial [Candidatus Bathyarchaeia archaeon]